MDFETTAFPHIIGALYGQALGNAWAMPACPRPQQTWSYFGGWVDQLQPAPPDHALYPGFEPGQVTADTHLALSLAQTLIAEGRLTPESAVQAVLNWYDHYEDEHSPLVDHQTQRLVTALKTNSIPEFISFYNSHLAASGIGPIGLIHAGNPEAAIQDAITFCTATHMTTVATSGACAVAAAIAKAISPNTTLEDIMAVAIHGATLGTEYGHPGLGASIPRRIELAVNWALDLGLNEEDRLQNLHDIIGVSPSTADVVPCAFGVLAMVDGNPVETAIYAAALSGKADTVGAIAGAIAGAWRTIDTIPIDYVDMLQAANPEFNMEETAEGLYEIAQKNYQDDDAISEPPLTSSFLDELAQKADDKG